MITKITTLSDVKKFAKYLVFTEKINFHCDEDFENYVNIDNGKSIYTKHKAKELNKLMQQCFDVCEKENVDIYDIMGYYIFKNLQIC